MLRAVLFDLDGTLLPMDQGEFVKLYFSMMAEKLAPYGYDPEVFPKNIWSCVLAMMANDGSCTNEERFWRTFEEIYGKGSRKHEPIFDDFYRNEFQKASAVSRPSPLADEIVKMLKKAGVKVILATNPLFPRTATESRIRWAGMDPDDFDLYSTFEDFCHCKPNIAYFEDVVERMHLDPKECIMVGNDVDEDMIASGLGMGVFLVDDYSINRNNKDISTIDHGSLADLKTFLEKKIAEQ